MKILKKLQRGMYSQETHQKRFPFFILTELLIKMGCLHILKSKQIIIHRYQSMPIKLYLDYISQPSRSVLAFCLINNIGFQLQEVRIAKLQHLDEAYEKINPMKKVPAILDTENGLMLGESHAIIAYLIKKYNIETKWYGKAEEITHWARVEEYLHYHHANTRKCAMLLYTLVFSRLYPVSQKPLMSEKELWADIQNLVTFIETNYFKESKYMVGPKLSIADLSAYFEIQSLILVDFPFEKWPKISQWMQIMSQNPKIAATNKNFIKMIPKMKGEKPKL